MNLFVLDQSPEQAAAYHCDAHVFKMCIEACQMMATAHWLHGEGALYLPTHENHPCNMWVRGSIDNYAWTYGLACALYGEYQDRFGKTSDKVEAVLETLRRIPELESDHQTPFVLAMPEEFHLDDPVQAYRDYYHTKWHMAYWTRKGNQPEWWRL